MGYVITLAENDFLIPKESIDKALKKVNHKFEKDYSSLREAMKEYGRWQMKATSKGLEIDYFAGEKGGWGEKRILDTISEYVKDESYIVMAGEDGDKWRYFFKNGEMKEQRPQDIVWG